MQHCTQMELIFFIFLHSSWFFEAELEYKDTYESFAEENPHETTRTNIFQKRPKTHPRNWKILMLMKSY